MTDNVAAQRRVAVIGAGPAGTTLALGLLQQGCHVTLVTERSAEEIRGGRVMSSQITFESALEVEASLGITDLLPNAPAIEQMALDFTWPDGARTGFASALRAPARSVDQRVKVPALLEAVERLGGKVVVRTATVDDIEDLAGEHDLVVVSTGRGGLAALFETDPAQSPYSVPQRVAALTYLRADEPARDGHALRYHRVDGVGECYTCPALTVDGPCDVVVTEGVPGGPLDCWDDVTTAEEHLDRLNRILAEHFPTEAARLGGARPVDDGAVLRGAITPVVRQPVGVLPSGRPVLGLADVVVLNDPVTSQGSNTAIKCAAFYLESIAAHDGPFDAAWMQGTFDNFWRGWAQWVSAWTNSWLKPTGDHQRAVVEAAARHETVATSFAAGFDDPRLFSPWWFDPEATERFLAEEIAAEQARFDLRDLRLALGQYATGVTVVTTEDSAGRRWAMTANSFTSVSLNPALVLWAASKSSLSLKAFQEATHFAVNVLGHDQHHLARQFSASGTDKFGDVALVPRDQVADPDDQTADSTLHPPILAGTVAHFVCRTTQQIDAGDHVVLIGEIEQFDAPGGEPLVFHSGSYRLAAKHPDL